LNRERYSGRVIQSEEALRSCSHSYFYRKELRMTYMLLIFVSGVLLVAVFAFLKERRLRLALQEILRRLLFRWRADEKK